MNAVEKALKKQLIGGILLSCMFAGGIPMIILGAVYSVLPVMIPGIAFTVAGFYGAPIVWVNYGNKLGLKRIVYAVEKEHLLTVPEHRLAAFQIGKVGARTFGRVFSPWIFGRIYSAGRWYRPQRSESARGKMSRRGMQILRS